jgi:hypothetical protein
MKYIIKEESINNIVKEYLDDTFNLENLHFTHTEFNQEGDYWGEIEDTGEYYFGDYIEDEIFARKYGYEYFTPRKGEPEDYPKLVLEYQYHRELDEMFTYQDLWEKPFIEWFNEKTGDNIKSLF